MNENPDFLRAQIITYIGNKRKILPAIEHEVKKIRAQLGGKKLVSADMFSGSGIVARLLKQHSEKLYVNDLELYARVINRCYLANQDEFDSAAYNRWRAVLEAQCERTAVTGIISAHYAPKRSSEIAASERVFYTPENARIIDTLRAGITAVPTDLQPFFLAPLLYEASVHVNTGGVFKGFYKNAQTGIGQFGGSRHHALSRIMQPIRLPEPVFSRFSAEVCISQQDANERVLVLEPLDLMYIDPPYNQHPYGSNYFMLNIIAENRMPNAISRVSGIPTDWNRSDYNRKAAALKRFTELIHAARARFLIISYNSEGFISLDEMRQLLSSLGRLHTVTIPYNTYRAGRNLKKRSIYVDEYLFVLKKW